MRWGWQLRGACAGDDVEMFFAPEGTRGVERALYEAIAKEVCTACPVRQTCLEEALAHGEYGVWGGTSEQERSLMRRSQREQPA